MRVLSALYGSFSGIHSVAVLLAVLWNCTVASAENPAAVKEKPSGGSGGLSGTFANEEIEASGKKRAYRLVVPKSVDNKKAVPLVFAFHGALIDGKDLMPIYSGLNKLAETHDFILVYPESQDKLGWRLMDLVGARQDVALFDEIYARVTQKYNVDLNRVYACGMSSGGFFSHVLATKRSDKIAAIACHSGGLPCAIKSARKYAALIIHGETDSIVNVSMGRAAHEAYKKADYPVKYIEIPKHDHFWATFQGINSSIWDFFVAHPISH
jgi:poly(3-hydroxybutyrate) depolymerase